MIRGQAGQSIGAQMISAADGSAFTGPVTVYITIDAGAQTIGSVAAGLCTHEGNGYHTYRPTLEETDGALIAWTFIGSAAIPQTIQVETTSALQASALQTATGTLAITARQLITDALIELGVLNAVDPASGEDADLGLRRLNMLLDGWNADRQTVYADTIAQYTITPGLNPHTIGPNTATFSVTQRPVSLEGANLLIGDVRHPLKLRDAEWWMSAPTQIGQPNDLYYEPSWPNGNLWFGSTPTGADTIELRSRVLLGALTLSDTFSLPPGYQLALMLSLAEQLMTPLKVRAADVPDLAGNARRARARIFEANTVVPKIVTRPYGGRAGGTWYGGGSATTAVPSASTIILQSTPIEPTAPIVGQWWLFDANPVYGVKQWSGTAWVVIYQVTI